MYQKVIFVGNLGRDPELRFTPLGKPVCNFSVATNESWTDRDGQKQERVTWLRVSVWDEQAEACAKYLSKGRQVFVEGRLTPDPETGNPRIWEGSDGIARASFEVKAFTVKFLGGRSEPREEGYVNPEYEDDIPF